MIRDISGDNRSLEKNIPRRFLEEVDYLTNFVNDLLDLSLMAERSGHLKSYGRRITRLLEDLLARYLKEKVISSDCGS